ncbi:MAG: AAA family ATPase [Phycisphaerae bacterium]|nr:AAA family ATPase [Phycisphaerae bacterium]
MRTVAFFNNKGGVGKTSLVYHLAWMYSELGISVVAADLDPQANLTNMLIGDETLEEYWLDEHHAKTVYGAIKPQLEGTGDLADVHVESIAPNFGAIIGDLALASAENELNSQWPECADGRPRGFRVISAIWRVIEAAAAKTSASIVLLDVGPNLGAINRAALLAAQHIIVPLAPDLYSVQGLRNLKPTIREWRSQWASRVVKNPVKELSLPPGEMTPAGYIVMQHAVRMRYPVMAYDRWIKRIPAEYREYVLDLPAADPELVVETDPECRALLQHYRSLIALAEEARKPMFMLRAGYGAIGGHATAVRDCRNDFEELAKRVLEKCGIVAP